MWNAARIPVIPELEMAKAMQQEILRDAGVRTKARSR